MAVECRRVHMNGGGGREHGVGGGGGGMRDPGKSINHLLIVVFEWTSRD